MCKLKYTVLHCPVLHTVYSASEVDWTNEYCLYNMSMAESHDVVYVRFLHSCSALSLIRLLISSSAVDTITESEDGIVLISLDNS